MDAIFVWKRYKIIILNIVSVIKFETIELSTIQLQTLEM